MHDQLRLDLELKVYARKDSRILIFHGNPPAGRDYVVSIEYSSEILKNPNTGKSRLVEIKPILIQMGKLKLSV